MIAAGDQVPDVPLEADDVLARGVDRIACVSVDHEVSTAGHVLAAL